MGELLREHGYLADRGLSTALYVALQLGRPVLLEGEVGVGKTEVAKALAQALGRRLIRLQCYEGIDTHQAIYEWDYARQMLAIRAMSDGALAGGALSGGALSDRARSEGAESDGARSDGVRSDGARSEGAESVGARSDGVRSDGARSEGAESDGVRSEEVGSDGVGSDGPRPGAAIPGRTRPDAILSDGTRSEPAVAEDAVDALYGPKFLVERPLLEAVRAGAGAVLLVDEIDRADDEFEAFLLELLSDFQITIPELGTIRAQTRPLVVLTSNRTRDLHDALKRRCLFHWVGYPTVEQEVAIVALRAPRVSEVLARKVVAAVHRLRELDLVKPPGVAETIDWVEMLDVLGETDLDPRSAPDTLGAVVKDRDDLDLVHDEWARVAGG